MPHKNVPSKVKIVAYVTANEHTSLHQHAHHAQLTASELVRTLIIKAVAECGPCRNTLVSASIMGTAMAKPRVPWDVPDDGSIQPDPLVDLEMRRLMKKYENDDE